MGISRRLPQSNLGRYTALRSALNQHNNAGADTVLTNQTVSRLKAIEPQYAAALKNDTIAEAQSADAGNAKTTAQAACRIYASHGLQTIIMAVQRGEMPLATLLLYRMDESTPSLPGLGTEQEVVAAAENFLNGEAARTAAGGTPLPMPTAVQVQAKLEIFNRALDNQNTAQINLKKQEATVEALNTEANGVIKKVWDEAETFYNEQPDETRRANCRLWGVVYVSDVRISITGVVLKIANGQAQGVEDATITLVQSNETTTTKTNGLFELKSGYTGAATITIEAPALQTITLQQNIDGTDDINLGEVTMS